LWFLKLLSKKRGAGLISKADLTVPTRKNMPDINRKKNKDIVELDQKKLLELHRQIMALEKLDIRVKNR
jgi:hypothetical protein